MKTFEPSWHLEKTPDELEKIYTAMLPTLREAARACGYALGLHGSMRRDLDLIAVPWTKKAVSADTLAHRLCKAACGLRHKRYDWEEKPNGRKATIVPVGMLTFIDLSVMPKL